MQRLRFRLRSSCTRKTVECSYFLEIKDFNLKFPYMYESRDSLNCTLVEEYANAVWGKSDLTHKQKWPQRYFKGIVDSSVRIYLGGGEWKVKEKLLRLILLLGSI